MPTPVQRSVAIGTTMTTQLGLGINTTGEYIQTRMEIVSIVAGSALTMRLAVHLNVVMAIAVGGRWGCVIL